MLFSLPNSNYICYVLQKRMLCSHTVWSTLRTVSYDAPRAGFSKLAPRSLGHFLQKPKMAALCDIAGSERIGLTNNFFNGQKHHLQKQNNRFLRSYQLKVTRKACRGWRAVFISKERAAELLLLSEHDLEMDNFHSNMDELFTCLKRLRVYFEKTAGDVS